MISRKTGALIRCALTLGAIIGTDDEDVIDAFRDCGRSLGLVFQIRDDVLGIWGDEGTTGKPVGADIRRKKNTLPVVYAMSRASGSDKDLLASIYRDDDMGDDEVTAVLGVLETVGAREYAHRLAAEHCDMALESLATAELSPQALKDMGELARFLLVREH
jgi:geranylgeranyl diphosphate synthase type I